MTILPLLLLSLSTIQIDGVFEDWEEDVMHQEDAKYIYKRIELPSASCLQQLPEQQIEEIGDYQIFFSPKGKGYGVSCKKGGEWVSPYEAGIVFAPTVAAKQFEIRVNKTKSELPKHPFALTPKGDLRVVSWNVQFGNLLEDSDRGYRLLKALQPNILLLQELDGDDTPEKLNLFLQKALGGSWKTEMSVVHGTKRHHQLRSAISTSLNVINMTEIEGVRAVHGSIKVMNETISCLSLHLRCCGGPTGEAEQRRQEEATIIRTAIDANPSSMWIVAGDWNLVGTSKPLEIVRNNELTTVDAFQPDGALCATWSDVTSSFTPGRLDWMLYTPNSLQVTHCFVLDTADLDSKTLNKHNLSGEDTAELSDHLPLVADFKILK